MLVMTVRFKRRWLREHFSWFRRLYDFDRDWFLYFPVVIGLFGLYGLMPDILYAIGLLPKDVVRSDFFNIFLGYSWFESVEDLPEYAQMNRILNWFGEIILFTVAVGMLVFYIRLSNQIISSPHYS
ncbi:MAG: hypothetical protein COC22_00535 [Flavobacteriaceae bacterium]|nr:MAG: hypothetical protein COC22_00535 [Flavobacteriaceae bacterium]